MENKESFILYTRYLSYAENLTDEEFGALMRAVFRYEAEKVCPEDGSLSPYIKALFDIIRHDLDKNRKKYDEVRTARIEAGIKGAKAKKAKKANEANEAIASDESKCEQNEQNKLVMLCNDMLCNDMLCSEDAAEAASDARVCANTVAAEEKSGVFELYEKLIGPLTQRVTEVLDGYEISDELKIKAIETAHDSNVRSLRYIEAILQGYEKDGVKSVADADRRVTEYRQRKTGKGDRAAPSRPPNYDFDEIERLEFERRMKE